MLTDAHSLDTGTTLNADVCIVGSGAAGITLAVELLDRGIAVLVLESGGLEMDAATQALTQARCEGTIVDSGAWPPGFAPPATQYFTGSRGRWFGGTTNWWGGLCRPFDPIDFEERGWVPHSGWPMAKADLDPYYRRAAALCEIPPFEASAYHQGTPTRPAVPTGDSGLQNRILYFSPPTRFGERYRERLVRSTTTHIVTHGNLVELECPAPATLVTRARALTLDGKPFSVAARYFVLATGAVENARLLLLSDRVQPQGLGNANDLVGRFYMDHCYIYPAHLIVLADPQYWSFYLTGRDETIGCNTVGMLCLTDEVQRQHRLHNNGLVWASGRRGQDYFPIPPEDLDLARAVTSYAREAGAVPEMTLLSCSPECTPNPASRVTLDDARDALGCRRARVDWRLNDADAVSIRRTLELAARALGRLAAGRMRLLLSEYGPYPRASGGTHHSGTTRMSRDPAKGVVNADGRMHQVGNLYLAGSSVFPTLGASNPTLTIVALAVRLADHLREVLSRE